MACQTMTNCFKQTQHNMHTCNHKLTSWICLVEQCHVHLEVFLQPSNHEIMMTNCVVVFSNE